jgi:hypothetical protein
VSPDVLEKVNSVWRDSSCSMGGNGYGNLLVLDFESLFGALVVQSPVSIARGLVPGNGQRGPAKFFEPWLCQRCQK